MKKGTSFLHKNTHHSIHAVALLFLFNFWDWKYLILLNGVLFRYEIPNKTILLWMDYDVALRLEKNESGKK